MDIIGIGHPCIDLLVNVDRTPTGNKGARMLAYSWQGGGKASTGVVASARLGASVGMVGIVGDDPFGRFCLADFERHGIDVSHLLVQEGVRTAFGVPISERATGDRNIIYHPGSRRELEIADLDQDYIASARYMLLCGVSETTLQAARWMREAGGKVCFDVDHPGAMMAQMTPLVDIYIASEMCYRSEHGDSTNYEAACRAVQAQGPEIVVYTLGPGGSVGVAGDTYFEAPSIAIQPVDTTGAGDTYHGAFLYGLAQGWDAAYVARFSNVVAAIKCLYMGGRAGIPNAELTKAVMEANEVRPDMPGLADLEARQAFYSEFQV